MERQSSFQEDNEFASSPDESNYSSDGNVDFNAAFQMIQCLARMMNHQLRNQVRTVEAICYLLFKDEEFSLLPPSLLRFSLPSYSKDELLSLC